MDTDAPKFKNLSIYRQYNGALEARAEFEGPLGSVKLVLDEQTADEMLRVCADAIVRASRNVAENLTASVIEHASVPAIPDGRETGR